jgi:hypothetical protein
MVVNADFLQEASDYIKWVNSLELKEIVFRSRESSDFIPTSTVVEDWKFAGLSNVWFAKEYGIINE